MTRRPTRVYECQRPGCGFRFPAIAGVPASERCPRCGYPAKAAAVESPPRGVAPSPEPPPGPPLEALLDNIRSTFNVGAMFRTADGAGIRCLHLSGVSATPENIRTAKTALGAELRVPWDYSPNGLGAAQEMAARGLKLWALEGGEGTVSIFEAVQELDDAPIGLAVGNEISGVDPGILALCQKVVHIPMQGYKRSLNVAIAFGIAAYMIRFAPSPRR